MPHGWIIIALLAGAALGLVLNVFGDRDGGVSTLGMVIWHVCSWLLILAPFLAAGVDSPTTSKGLFVLLRPASIAFLGWLIPTGIMVANADRIAKWKRANRRR